MKFSMNNCSYWLPRCGFILSGDWVKNPIASFVLSTSACNNLFPMTMKAMPMSFLIVCSTWYFQKLTAWCNRFLHYWDWCSCPPAFKSEMKWAEEGSGLDYSGGWQKDLYTAICYFSLFLTNDLKEVKDLVTCS